MSRTALDAARALRRGEGLLGLNPNMVILAMLTEIERLQALVRAQPMLVPVAGVACDECGAGPTQNCDIALHTGFVAAIRDLEGSEDILDLPVRMRA